MITPTQNQRVEAYLAITKDGVLQNEAILVEIVATLIARNERLIEVSLDIHSDTPS